jgi:thymidylate synthase
MVAQVVIRDEQLFMTVFQRSSDAFTGLVYDVPWHCELMNQFVKDLKQQQNLKNLRLGSLNLFMTSIHLYTKDIDKAEKICRNPISMAG